MKSKTKLRIINKFEFILDHRLIRMELDIDKFRMRDGHVDSPTGHRTTWTNVEEDSRQDGEMCLKT